MRQRITSQVLTDLSTPAINRWFSWTGEKGYSSRASIGEMFEFLWEEGNRPLWPNLAKFINRMYIDGDTNLCETLWDNCKLVLERRNGDK